MKYTITKEKVRRILTDLHSEILVMKSTEERISKVSVLALIKAAMDKIGNIGNEINT